MVLMNTLEKILMFLKYNLELYLLTIWVHCLCRVTSSKAKKKKKKLWPDSHLYTIPISNSNSLLSKG